MVKFHSKSLLFERFFVKFFVYFVCSVEKNIKSVVPWPGDLFADYLCVALVA
jgi:hypothetical protein